MPDPDLSAESLGQTPSQIDIPIVRLRMVQATVKGPSFCDSEALRTRTLVPVGSAPISWIASSTFFWSSASKGMVSSCCRESQTSRLDTLDLALGCSVVS